MTLPTAIASALAAALEDSTPTQRAELVDDFVQAVYDHVKFRAPEGGGLDGRDGPERDGLGDILGLAHDHVDDTVQRERQGGTSA